MKKDRKVRLFPSANFQPSEERQKLFAVYWAEAQTRQRLSSDNFDKAILTYSSSGLALSVAFLKDIVPLNTAKYEMLLYASWLFFTCATCSTVISFLASYKSQAISVDYAEKYYLEGKEEFLNKSSWHSHVILWANRLAGALFVLALASTCFFVGFNLREKGSAVKKINIAQDGALSAHMPKASDLLNKGLPAASMPKGPATQKPTTKPTPTPPKSPGG